MDKKIFTIFAIAFLLISGVALTGCTSDENGNGEEKQVELELSKPQAHEMQIGIKATVTRDQGSYKLTLTNPDGTTENTGHISSSEMNDGKHAVWLYMADIQVNPKLGTYNVTLSEYGTGDVLKTKTFTYNGLDVTVNSADTKWEKSVNEFNLNSVTLNIKNKGDVGYATQISVNINGNTSKSYLNEYGPNLSPISAGSKKEITASTFGIYIEEGSYEATIKLLDDSGTTLDSYTKTVNIGDSNGNKEIKLELSKPQAHDMWISVKATVTGDQASYDLTLTAPDESTASSGYIMEDEMNDGKHAVWLSMGDTHTNPNTGEYKVTLSESMTGDVLKTKTFTYNGPDVTVNSADFTWNTYEYMESDLDSVNVSLSNSGDAGYITKISVTINETTGKSYIDGYTDDRPLPANSDEEYTASGYILEPGSGEYDAEIKLLDDSGSTVATYTTSVNVP